jgi:hypothetical protein
MVPQLGYFDVKGDVIEVEPAPWTPGDITRSFPDGAHYSSFYVDWDDEQLIILVDRDGKVSRCVTSDMTGRGTMEIGVHDGDYIDSLGGFAMNVERHGPAQG